MIPQGELPKVALIDADFLAYSIGFTSEDDEEQWAKNRLTEWLTNIVYMDLECDDYVAYTTGKTNFRYDVAKSVPYKGNRKDMKRPRHLDALKEHLRRLGAVAMENCEADDAVAIELTKAPDKYWIVHVDKDLDQLVGWHYNPNKEERYYIDQFTADLNFWTQMLTGDRVDNIPGIPGIGPKKAEKALFECTTYAQMEQAAWELYQKKGFGFDYFKEQGQLLWLQRYEGQLWEPTINETTISKAEGTSAPAVDSKEADGVRS